MQNDRQALLVQAAFRGIMEAVLSIGVSSECKNKQAQKHKRSGQRSTAPKVLASENSRSLEEIPFPSVSQYEENLFGEAMPVSNMDIDMAVEALSLARAMEAREAAPQVQPGPGESEVATGWAIPQP